MISVIIDFGKEPVRYQPVPVRTSVSERPPVRASSYRAESREQGNYSRSCRVRRLDALREPRVDIATDFGSDHPSRYTVNSKQTKAEAWLNSVNNTALSVNMPMESKLNFCAQYLTEADKFWYNRVVALKTVTTLPEFEKNSRELTVSE
jgi:hypothetical protein